MTVHKSITQKLRYTKKQHYGYIDMYVCMHRMGVPLRHTSVPMLGLGLVGAAPISSSTYALGGYATLAFRSACTRRLFEIVFGDSLFVYNFECDLFAFYCFYCLFAVALYCNCSAYAPM